MLEIKENILGSIQCHVYDEYLANRNQNLCCWELAERNKDFCFEYKVCQDCIVFRYATEHDTSVKEHFEDILRTRNFTVIH